MKNYNCFVYGCKVHHCNECSDEMRERKLNDIMRKDLTVCKNGHTYKDSLFGCPYCAYNGYAADRAKIDFNSLSDHEKYDLLCCGIYKNTVFSGSESLQERLLTLKRYATEITWFSERTFILDDIEAITKLNTGEDAIAYLEQVCPAKNFEEMNAKNREYIAMAGSVIKAIPIELRNSVNNEVFNLSLSSIQKYKRYLTWHWISKQLHAGNYKEITRFFCLIPYIQLSDTIIRESWVNGILNAQNYSVKSQRKMDIFKKMNYMMDNSLFTKKVQYCFDPLSKKYVEVTVFYPMDFQTFEKISDDYKWGLYSYLFFDDFDTLSHHCQRSDVQKAYEHSLPQNVLPVYDPPGIHFSTQLLEETIKSFGNGLSWEEFEMESSDYAFVGVYVLYNENKKACYVGQAMRISDRISDHFNGRDNKTTGGGSIYRDFMNGDEIKIYVFPLKDSGYDNLNVFEKKMIEKCFSYLYGYNHTIGNNKMYK